MGFIPLLHTNLAMEDNPLYSSSSFCSPYGQEDLPVARATKEYSILRRDDGGLGLLRFIVAEWPDSTLVIFKDASEGGNAGGYPCCDDDDDDDDGHDHETGRDSRWAQLANLNGDRTSNEESSQNSGTKSTDTSSSKDDAQSSKDEGSESMDTSFKDDEQRSADDGSDLTDSAADDDEQSMKDEGSESASSDDDGGGDGENEYVGYRRFDLIRW